MKSARVEWRTTWAATSLRFPVCFVFLVAVLTLLSCRTATRRCVFKCHPLDDDVANSLLPDSTLSVSLNATTLLRLASVDVNEKADATEIQGLLNTNGFGTNEDEGSMQRSIASWRRFHRLDTGVDQSSSANLLHISEERFSCLFSDFHRSLRQWYRNRRLQPGVMSELLDLVKRPIDRHRSDPSFVTERNKYRTCAVVGNSGILMKHQDGDLIDGHDLVIRLNTARTNGYDRNVGKKTSLAFVNSNILHLCSLREECDCHPYGPHVPMIIYICQPIHFLDYTICNGSHRAPLLITDARFDVLCSSIVKYYSLKRFVEKTGKSPGEWDKAHDAKMFHYSSGMQAVMLALGICDQVSIFGFGKFADAKHHYHTDQKAELDLHDYEAEYDLYRDLADRPQVIPFLRDSGFKIPPVVISHSLTS